MSTIHINLDMNQLNMGVYISLTQLLFGGSRRARTHISSKTEALFSFVTMTQRLMCRYLTAEK